MVEIISRALEFGIEIKIYPGFWPSQFVVEFVKDDKHETHVFGKVFLDEVTIDDEERLAKLISDKLETFIGDGPDWN